MNKLVVLLLVFSLAGNVWLWRQRGRDVSRVHSSTAGPGSSAVETAARKPGSVSAGSKTPSSFADLQTADLAALRAALQASGASPAMIRAIVSARIRQQHQSELAAFADLDGERNVWWRFGTSSPVARERFEQRNRLNEQIRAEIEAALGEKPNAPATDGRYAFLPEAKAVALQQIDKDYAELQRRAVSAGSVTVAEAKMLAEEQRRDLANLLSPEELAEYDLRFSPAGNQIKSRLGFIDGTEAEFRWLYAQQQNINQQYARAGLSVGQFAQQNAERDAAVRQLQDEILRTLGPERGAEYLWKGDQDYQRLRDAARERLLSESTLQQAMQLRSETSLRGGEIMQNSALSADQKRAALAALASTTRTQWQTLIPPGIVSEPQWLRYLDNGGVMKFDALSQSTSSTSLGPAAPPRK